MVLAAAVEAGSEHPIAAAVTVAAPGAVPAHVPRPADAARVFDEAGALDAVVSAAGSVPYKRITDMTPDDYLSAYHGKVASQVELVRQGTSRIAAPIRLRK